MEKTEMKISLTGLLNCIFDGQDASFPEALDALLRELGESVEQELHHAKNEGDIAVVVGYQKVRDHLAAARQAIL